MPVTSRLPTMPESIIGNKDFQAQIPRFKPGKFRRTISPGASRLTRAQSHRAQSESLLLNKLPLEVRLAIWECVFGRSVVTIARKKKRIGHQVRVRPLYIWEIKKREPFSRGSKLADWSLTSLLRTCRQVYIEAVNILYGTITFHFEHPWALMFLYETILPKRWERIRKVELVFSFMHCFHESTNNWIHSDQPPDDKETFETMCTEIMQIKSLERFVLVMEIAWCSDNAVTSLQATKNLAESKGLSNILKPLRGLRLNKGRPWTLVIPIWYVDNGEVETKVLEKGLTDAGFVCCVKAPQDIMPQREPVEW
ncbi:hypothetical protein DTO195F2_6282 [Paecilomyces variotii]|nr:hypothetical protein DTO195F2_6282 [Paecilomyces variotii]KAJ9347637.1 hypothetical protein DTO027B9_9000 [Paecilomyces variotii]KAJ9368192.1 hypothetical protein DTO282E5_7088 [Paecilomyces variotii]KAJ9399943.1 hypothetical protein DTO282F9_3013 [Paecilomyces variotii]